MTRLESGAIQPHIEPSMSPMSWAARSGARGKGSRAAPRRARLAAGSADAEARSRAVRAGAVQPSRQCGEIHAGRLRRSRSGVRARTGIVRLAGDRRGRGHPGSRSRTHLRQILSRAGGGPQRAGTARPRDLPRLRRSDGRHDRCRKPSRPHGRRFHDHAARSREQRSIAGDAA